MTQQLTHRPSPQSAQQSARSGAGGGGRPGRSCDRATGITKSLLGYGVIAGPSYVLVSVLQALTREGFDPTRHAWSLLSTGDLGWIQVANLIATGLMSVALAAGLRRALQAGRGATWAPRLVGAFGVGLLAAGVFRADPALGFPPGTPQDAADVTWHGILHFVSAGIGFGCLIAACFVLASRFRVDGHRRWATYSRATGVLFGLGFVAVASGADSAWTTLPFTATVVLAWVWVSALAIHLYRRAGHPAHG